MKSRGIEHLFAGAAALGAVAVLSGESRAEDIPLDVSIDSFGSGLSYTFFAVTRGGDDTSSKTFNWSIEHRDGVNVGEGTGAIFTHQFSIAGNYVVNLVVESEDGNVTETSTIVSIEPDIDVPENNPPVAKLTIDVEGSDIFMSAGQSFDEDGDVLTYMWDVVNVDGESVFVGVGKTVQTTISEPGLYKVNLVVEDEFGEFDTDNLTIEIREQEPEPPPSDGDRTEAPPPEGSISQENTQFGEPVLEVSLYQTESLNGRVGRSPEKTVANFLSGALDNIGISYRIHYNLPLQDAPSSIGINSPEDPRCEFTGGNIYPWWDDRVNQGDIFIRKDANLLLVNSSLGGCGSIDGRIGVMGVRRVDQEREWRRKVVSTTEKWAGQVYGAIHEIEHMLGYRHDKHWGVARNIPSEGIFEKSLGVGNYGTINVCGGVAEEKNHSTVRILFEYTECAKENMSIE